MFQLRFFIAVLPLFIVRDVVAHWVTDPVVWKQFEKISFKIWYPYYWVLSHIYAFIDSKIGKRARFETIEDAIPWDRLAWILCSVKQDFDRNRMLASLDMIYPVQNIAKKMLENKPNNNNNNNNNNSDMYLTPNEALLDKPIIECNHDLWCEARYAVKYATYVYFMDFLGMPKNVSILLGPFMPQPLSNDTFEAGYFVCFDELNERLILCIRGSSSYGDFGTDIDAIPTKMIHFNKTKNTIENNNSNNNSNNNNKKNDKNDKNDRNREHIAVHRGIWIAARRLDARIKDTLISKFMELKNSGKYNKLELMITGHSLGAGVTSLLGIIWYYGLTDNISKYSSIDTIRDSMYCYSFASPPVIDKNGRMLLLKNMKNGKTNLNVITSITNQIDIVTRMSIPGIYDISNKIQWIGNDIKNYDIINKIENIRCNNDEYIDIDKIIDTFDKIPSTTEIDVSSIDGSSSVVDDDAGTNESFIYNDNNNNNNNRASNNEEMETSGYDNEHSKKDSSAFDDIYNAKYNTINLHAMYDNEKDKNKRSNQNNADEVTTNEIIDFIGKFKSRYQDIESLTKLNLPHKVMKHQRKHCYEYLYPCGTVIWRIPRLKWDKLDESYQSLSSVINSGNLKNRLIVYYDRIMLDLFGDVDHFGNFKNDNNSCKTHFNQFNLHTINENNNNEEMIDLFENMVVNTGVALLDHMPGQYSSMFGINLITVFQQSERLFVKFLPSNFDDCVILKLLSCLIAICLCVIEWIWGRLKNMLRN